MHSDGSDRHSFVLDLMEPVRPFCDRLVLAIVNDRSQYFDRRWCHELGSGVCVLDPPLSHALAGQSADIGAEVMRFAWRVRKMYRNG